MKTRKFPLLLVLGLVLGGFDQSRQFGFCGQLDPGVKLTLTDMTGAVFSYTVTRVDRSQSADAAWLQDPDSDLTLFCRSLLSGTYLAVHCTLPPNHIRCFKRRPCAN